jgi:RHS repeat-associated protein
MDMPGRKFGNDNRYGFNGKERDKDMNSLTAYDYGFRIYNPAIGKFLSVDPLTQSYPWYTPYQFAGNKPIWCIDLDGLEETVPKIQISIPILTNAPGSTCIGCADKSEMMRIGQQTANLELLKKEYDAWQANNPLNTPIPPKYKAVVKSATNPDAIDQGGFLASKEYKLGKANYETYGKYLPGVSGIDDGLTFISHIADGNFKAAALTALFFLPGGDFLKPLKKIKSAGKLGGTACIDYASDFMSKYSKKITDAGGTVKKMEIKMNSGVIGAGIGAESKQLSSTGLHQFIEVSDASGAVKIFDNAHPEGILKSDYLKSISGSNTTDGVMDGAKLYEKYAKPKQ